MANNIPVSKKFPKLFHYTTVSAFKNIYKEQKFRATYYEDLNDKSELQRFRLAVCEDIKPIMREIFNRKLNNHQLEAGGFKISAESTDTGQRPV